jgi:hypothetical protein
LWLPFVGKVTLNSWPFTSGAVVTQDVPSKLAGLDENPAHPAGTEGAPAPTDQCGGRSRCGSRRPPTAT